jgi:hypothetical protein
VAQKTSELSNVLMISPLRQGCLILNLRIVASAFGRRTIQIENQGRLTAADDLLTAGF